MPHRFNNITLAVCRYQACSLYQDVCTVNPPIRTQWRKCNQPSRIYHHSISTSDFVATYVPQPLVDPQLQNEQVESWVSQQTTPTARNSTSSGEPSVDGQQAGSMHPGDRASSSGQRTKKARVLRLPPSPEAMRTLRRRVLYDATARRLEAEGRPTVRKAAAPAACEGVADDADDEDDGSDEDDDSDEDDESDDDDDKQDDRDAYHKDEDKDDTNTNNANAGEEGAGTWSDLINWG